MDPQSVPGRSDLAFSNLHIESIAMPCPMCLVAKRKIEIFSREEIRSFEEHLFCSHGMTR
jgi:hypothetical protein